MPLVVIFIVIVLGSNQGLCTVSGCFVSAVSFNHNCAPLFLCLHDIDILDQFILLNISQLGFV